MEKTYKLYTVDEVIDLAIPDEYKDSESLGLVESVYLKQVDQLKLQLEKYSLEEFNTDMLPESSINQLVANLNKYRLQVAKQFFDDLSVVIKSAKDYVDVGNDTTVNTIVLENYERLVVDPFEDYKINSENEFVSFKDVKKKVFAEGFSDWWDRVQEDPEAAYNELFYDEEVLHPIERKRIEIDRNLEERSKDLQERYNQWLIDQILVKKSREDLLYINRAVQSEITSTVELLSMHISSERARIQSEIQYSELVSLIKEQSDTIEYLKNEAATDSFIDDITYENEVYDDNYDNPYVEEFYQEDAILPDSEYTDMAYEEQDAQDGVDELDNYVDEIVEEYEDVVDPLAALDDDDDSFIDNLSDDFLNDDPLSLDALEDEAPIVDTLNLDDSDLDLGFSDEGLVDIPKFDDDFSDSVADDSFGADVELAVPTFDETADNDDFNFENELFDDSVDDVDDDFLFDEDDDNDDVLGIFGDSSLEFEPVGDNQTDDFDFDNDDLNEAPKKKGLFSR